MVNQRISTLIGFGLLVLGGCLSDGPNETGTAFLKEKGIVLQDPVLDLVLEDFPLEAFRSTLEETSHLGDTVAMLGHSQGVTAGMRLAFSLSNQVFLDSLDSADAGEGDEDGALRLVMGFPKWGGLDGDNPLPAQVYLEKTVAGHDSLQVLVRALTLGDPSKDQYNRVVSHYQRAFLDKRLPLDLITVPEDSSYWKAQEKTFTVDTITLEVSGLYDRSRPDSIQAHALPHLLDALKAKRLGYRYILLDLQPVAADTDLMLRPAGGIGAYYGPALLFGGGFDPARASTSKQRLEPYYVTATARSVTYFLEEDHENDDALGISPRRNLKFRIHRDTLLQRISRKLGGLPPSPQGEFDSRYFIPFGEISLPLDTNLTRIENDYALDVAMVSNLDSTAPSSDPGVVTYHDLKLSPGPESPQWETLWVIDQALSLRQKTDTLKVAYVLPEADSSVRILRFRRMADTTRDLDSLIIRPGQSRELSLNPGTRISLRVKVDARAEDYDLTFRLRSQSTVEAAGIRDPETGYPYTDNEDLTSRFLIPGNPWVSVRSTEGLQRTLNRVNLGKDLQQEFSLQVSGRGGLDPDTNFIRTYYPIQGSVRFPAVDGTVRAKIHLLLFPLTQP